MLNTIQTTIQSSKAKVSLLFAISGIVSLTAITFGFYSFLNTEKQVQASSVQITLQNGEICANWSGSDYDYLVYDGDRGQEVVDHNPDANKFSPYGSTDPRFEVRIDLNRNQCFTRPPGATGDSVQLINSNRSVESQIFYLDSLSQPIPVTPPPATPAATQPSGITFSTEQQVLSTGQVCAYNVPANYTVQLRITRKETNIDKHGRLFQQVSGSTGGDVCWTNETGHFHFAIYDTPPTEAGDKVREHTVW
jgi:hypothetical protein